MSEDSITETAENRVPAAPLPLDIPTTTEALLDAHIAEALKIVRDFSNWIQAPAADIETCMPLSERVCSLMNASANAARSATRARMALQPKPQTSRG